MARQRLEYWTDSPDEPAPWRARQRFAAAAALLAGSIAMLLNAMYVAVFPRIFWYDPSRVLFTVLLVAQVLLATLGVALAAGADARSTESRGLILWGIALVLLGAIATSAFQFWP